jgi:hypothetical protein
MIRRMQKFATSRSAYALFAALLAALLSACSPSSPTAAAKPAAAELATADPSTAKPATAESASTSDPDPNLPEIVITASRLRSTPPALEPKSVRVRTHSRDKSS